VLWWGLVAGAGCIGLGADAEDAEGGEEGLLGQQEFALRAQLPEVDHVPVLGQDVHVGGVPDDLPALADPDPDGPFDGMEMRCLCIPIPESEGCVQSQFFCNASGSCFCDGDASGPVSSLTAGLAQRLGAKAPVSPSPRSSAALADLELGLSAEPPPPPGCICGFGTASVPSGNCAEEDWYCNRSGVCRCSH